MDLPDTYVLRARLYPAVLALAPALVLLLILFLRPGEELGLPDALLAFAVGVLFFAFADLARRIGKRVEQNIFSSNSGRPFPDVLRHGDGTIDKLSKVRYHQFLAGKLGVPAPTPEQEKLNPPQADQFYVMAGNWLRERTRDTSAYSVLFAENVVYGFRRNLLGVKWPGLGLNLAASILCGWLIWQSGGKELPRYGLVLGVAVLHAAYFLFAVNRAAVIAASKQYGRQLVLSCETLETKTSGTKPQA